MTAARAAMPRGTAREATVIAILTITFTFVGVLVTSAGTQFVRSGEIVPRMTLADLTSYADAIVTAQVVDVRQTARPIDQSGRIAGVVTASLLVVATHHKGTAASELTVSTEGGRSGGVVHFAEDEPTYRIGETVTAFLVRRPDGTYATVGAWQGLFKISGNNASNGALEIPRGALLDAIARGH